MHDLLSSFLKARAFAQQTKYRRWITRPLRHLTGFFLTYAWYRVFQRSVTLRAEIFTGDRMMVPLPAGLEFYLTGVKTHDSELRHTAFLLRTLGPGDVVLDAGAHLGYYALCMAHLVGQTGRVIAFEPGQGILPFLQKNVSGKSQVQVIEMVLGDKTGGTTYYEFPVHNSEFNAAQDQQPESPGFARRQVQSTTLDTFFHQAETTPRLIKMDVEGGELAVLKGGAKTLSQVSAIAMEVRKPGYDQLYAESIQYLDGLGFSAYRIDADGVLLPLDKVRGYILGLPEESDNLDFTKSKVT